MFQTTNQQHSVALGRSNHFQPILGTAGSDTTHHVAWWTWWAGKIPFPWIFLNNMDVNTCRIVANSGELGAAPCHHASACHFWDAILQFKGHDGHGKVAHWWWNSQDLDGDGKFAWSSPKSRWFMGNSPSVMWPRRGFLGDAPDGPDWCSHLLSKSLPLMKSLSDDLPQEAMQHRRRNISARECCSLAGDSLLLQCFVQYQRRVRTMQGEFSSFLRKLLGHHPVHYITPHIDFGRSRWVEWWRSRWSVTIEFYGVSVSTFVSSQCCDLPGLWWRHRRDILIILGVEFSMCQKQHGKKMASLSIWGNTLMNIHDQLGWKVKRWLKHTVLPWEFRYVQMISSYHHQHRQVANVDATMPTLIGRSRKSFTPAIFAIQ